MNDRPLMIDALQYSNWDREIFEEIRRGGLSCIHVTLVIWEGARETLDVIGRWHRLLREHEDLITLAQTGGDIATAHSAGRTAIVFGFQNASPFEDDLALVEVFHRLGVRIVQLTYNTQNHVGSSCYEPHDSGLSRFGKLVVREMDRVGMLIDLSHVGERTTLEAIEASSRPVSITHANPASVFPHPRNKSDEVLRALARRGGVLGCAPYPHLTGGGEITLEQWCDMVARAADLMGVDHVGIGSDASRKWTDDYLMWIRMGRWTHEVDYGAGSREQPGWAPWPSFYQTPADFPRLAEGLSRRGFSSDEVGKMVGGNWLRLFTEAFEPQG